MNRIGHRGRLNGGCWRTPRAPLYGFHILFVLNLAKALVDPRRSLTNDADPSAIMFSIPHLGQKLLPNKSIL